MPDNKLKLEKKYVVSGKIHAISGLHIGGNDAGLSIGNPDATVIKHPISGIPYIPGSSIKGKMRSLIELRDGTIGKVNSSTVKFGPTDDIKDRAAKIFGTANQERTQRPSRVIFRDANLIDLKYANPEIKTETMIDRITAKANPRQLERVPAGAAFAFKIILNVFESHFEDPELKESDNIEEILGGLLMIQDDFLGGKGSRGSGEVKFEIESIKEKSADYYKDPSVNQIDKTSDFKEKFKELFKSAES